MTHQITYNGIPVDLIKSPVPFPKYGIAQLGKPHIVDVEEEQPEKVYSFDADEFATFFNSMNWEV